MICVIDNYDSFTFNLVQILQKNNLEVEVFKNDQVTVQELLLRSSEIEAFLLSPGPGNPEQSGICKELVKAFYKEKPILGVCLGHQILAEFFGGKVIRAPRIMHGKISNIFHSNNGIYKDIPNPFLATRYHSLIVDIKSLTSELEVQSWTQSAHSEVYELMGFRHRELPIEGMQFHPESLMTPQGEYLVMQFFKS